MPSGTLPSREIASSFHFLAKTEFSYLLPPSGEVSAKPTIGDKFYGNSTIPYRQNYAERSVLPLPPKEEACCFAANLNKMKEKRIDN